MRQILKALVDGQLERPAFARCLQIFDVLNNSALAILDDTLLASRACERALLGELDTFLSLIILASKADDVGRDIARGVEATKFALLEHAGNF